MKACALPKQQWLDRCSRQLLRREPDLPPADAAALAQDLFDFERTAVMSPELAVEFVAEHLAHPGDRLERRARTRPRG